MCEIAGRGGVQRSIVEVEAQDAERRQGLESGGVARFVALGPKDPPNSRITPHGPSTRPSLPSRCIFTPDLDMALGYPAIAAWRVFVVFGRVAK